MNDDELRELTKWGDRASDLAAEVLRLRADVRAKDAEIARLRAHDLEAELTASFQEGFAVACGLVVSMYDEPTIAASVMAQANLSWEEIERMGLSEYDMQSLRVIRDEPQIKAFRVRKILDAAP